MEVQTCARGPCWSTFGTVPLPGAWFSVAASAHAPRSGTSSLRQLPALPCRLLHPCSPLPPLATSHTPSSSEANGLTDSTAVGRTGRDIQGQWGNSESGVPLPVRTRDPETFSHATGSRDCQRGLLQSGSASARLQSLLTVMGFSDRKEPSCG